MRLFQALGLGRGEGPPGACSPFGAAWTRLGTVFLLVFAALVLPVLPTSHLPLQDYPNQLARLRIVGDGERLAALR